MPNVPGALVKQGMEKVDILNAFYALVLTSKITLQESQRLWGKFGAACPSSLTSIPRNVMEQVVLEATSRQLTNKKNTRSRQHGFTKSKSCLINLITFHGEMAAW